MITPTTQQPSEQPLALFSYGFRPFFLGAALFAGMAIPVWILTFAGGMDGTFRLPPRDWHVHEMVFGFLPAVITGFLLTAIPNWTDRPPVKGNPLILLMTVWLAGRVMLVIPWLSPVLSAVIDSAFLIIVAGLLWREIIAGGTWDRSPLGVLISVYAVANILFHVQTLNHQDTDIATRLALTLIMILLALIGGRITPGFTEDYLSETGHTQQPAGFSRFDGISIFLVALAAVAWTTRPHHPTTGGLLMVAGLVNLVRLSRWCGWLSWREPLVLILHIGYGWLALSLVILSGSIFGTGPAGEDAVHALTTGAVGSMTLAVMTRASLGHTGRPKHAGTMTVVIYALVNLGALVRVTAPTMGLQPMIMLGIATLCWSGAYLLFAGVYGPILIRPSLDDE